MNKDLLFTIPKKYHNKESLISIFEDHPEIKFVSLVGVDLAGNDTDEKIPSKLFLKDMDSFLHGTAVQTDGSSVVLPGIATLNNAKVDMIADLDCKWFVDYNYDFIDPLTNRPVGTLRIPCFLIHEDKAVDSRHILKNSIDTFKSNIFSLLKKYPETLNDLNIKFYASVRLDVRGNTQIKGTGDKKDQNVGKETKIKVVKNKVAPPFKEAFVEIMYGEGISQTGELVKIASDLGIIQKAGAWFSYNGEKIGQGSENAKKYLADHPDIFEEIDHKVRVHYGLIEPDEEDIVEEAQVEETSDELVLDLDSTIEIEE